MKLKGGIAIFLVGVILIGSMSFPLFISYLSFNKSEFRAQALGSFNKASAKELVINTKDLYEDKNGITWHDQMNELDVNGEFFEVEAVKIVGDQALISLLKDKTESDFFCSFVKNSKEKIDLLVSFFKVLNNFNYFNTPTENQFYFNLEFERYTTTASSIVSGTARQLFRPPSI